MKQYETYTVADFVADEDFRDWVRGCSNREAFWLTFGQQYPDKRDALRQAEQFVRAATVAPERVGEAEIRKETERFIEVVGALQTPTQSASTLPIKKTAGRFFGWGMGIAALLLLVVGVGWYFDRSRPAPVLFQAVDAAVTQPLVETVNPTQQPLRLVLSDDSEVLLSPKSRLRYPARFAGSVRAVYLTGEGRFSVTRRNQPFQVRTGETITNVLGTRFVVRAFATDPKITVQVLSGKVSVHRVTSRQTPDDKAVSGLILHVNQAAIFEKGDGHLTKTLVTHPTLVAPKSTQPDFVYDDVALSAILRQLETSYGIPVQFDEQSFRECRITAVLSNESLYEKLDLLCKAASARYEIMDGQIVISRRTDHKPAADVSP